MAALVAEKIFVDPNEEISFLVERIMRSGKEYNIIIVPSASVLFASNLSIKILYRSIIKASKVTIIVTEDTYGAKISQKVGFVVVQKVSQITSDLWEVAKGKLYAAQSNLNNKKDDLLKNIKGEAPTQEDNTVEVFETSESKIEDVAEKEDSQYNQISEEIEEKKSDDTRKGFELATEPEPEPVIRERVKEVGGITIYSGTDIATLKSRKNDDKIDELDNLDMNGENKEDLSVFSEKRFAGRDVTKMTPEKSGLSKFFGSIFGGNKVLRPEDRMEGATPVKWYKRRSVIIAFVLLIVLIAITYLTLFQFSNVSIRINLQSETVVAEETVEIDISGSAEIDVDSLVIPGRTLETEEISTSTTATASGEGRRGEKATGAVYIFNKEQEDILIPAGTELTSVRTGEVYETVEEVTLPAATEASDLSINPSRTDNIRVVAVSFGEESNIDDSDPDSGFTIEGFDTISSQDIKREGAFEGGSGEDFVSVSEENFEQVKEETLETLEERAKEALLASVPNGFSILEETIEFEEVDAFSNPEVGEEANLNAEEEYIFDVTIVGKATGVMVRDEDLEQIIQAAILENEESDAGDVNDLSNIGFKDFVENNTGIFITVFAEGEVVSSFNQDDLFNEIKGKSINDARSIIETYDEIQTFDLRYFPSVIPESLQFIPNSNSRITFRID